MSLRPRRGVPRRVLTGPPSSWSVAGTLPQRRKELFSPLMINGSLPGEEGWICQCLDRLRPSLLTRTQCPLPRPDQILRSRSEIFLSLHLRFRREESEPPRFQNQEGPVQTLSPQSPAPQRRCSTPDIPDTYPTI